MVEHMRKSVTAGEIHLLENVAAGQYNREIGERLFTTEETVKVHEDRSRKTTANGSRV
jgi:DNA-binding NarL/FixJ family response regulator